MQKYGGTLVHSQRDEYGLIEVVENSGIRSLHFETPIQQSSIDLRQPEALVFEYYRVLCLSLLMQKKFGHLLVLGLGGGALTKFLLDACPDSEITAVEFREAVVDVAFDWFQLPVDPRLETWVADAHAFLAQTEQDYEVIFIDLYDALGISESLSEWSFLDACVQKLKPGGVLAINLWHNPKDSFSRTQSLLEDLFGEHVFYISVDDANTVALAVHADSAPLSGKKMKQAARHLENRTGLDLIANIKRLRRRDHSGLG